MLKSGTQLYTAFDVYVVEKQIGQGGNGFAFTAPKIPTMKWLRLRRLRE